MPNQLPQREENFETRIVREYFTNSCWPIEPRCSDPLTQTASELQELVFHEENWVLYRDLFLSLLDGGGKSGNIQWTELADACMDEIYGDDWSQLDETQDE